MADLRLAGHRTMVPDQMFPLSTFRQLVLDLTETLSELKTLGIEENLSVKDYNAGYKMYVFDHTNTTTVIASLDGDVKSTEVRFRVTKETKEIETTISDPELYRPELELMYFSELEKILNDARKSLDKGKIKHDSTIMALYLKVVKERELKQKRQTSCYIK